MSIRVMWWWWERRRRRRRKREGGFVFALVYVIGLNDPRPRLDKKKES